MSVEVIRSPVLAGVPHGFLGRRGGVSTGVVAGLNVGSGSNDDPERVAENVRRACDAVLSGAELARVYQVHSATALVAELWPLGSRPQADAMVTDRPGLLLGIITADCAPVLFADIDAGIVGAAHAGWRGAVAGVTDNTIAAMEGLGANRDRIVAAVGPCIAQASYEVDATFRDALVQTDPSNDRFFVPGAAGKPHFDLEAYIVARLDSAGIGRVEALSLDTYADADRFFSYRRATHGGDPDYGRQFSLIGLPS